MKLEQSEEWLKAIFEASRDGIFVESNEHIVYVNKSCLRLFGYDQPEDLIGKQVSIVVSLEDKERMLEFGRRRVRGETSPPMYEFKGKRKDGSLIDLEASVSTSTISSKLYITTVIHDIAERKQAEEALRKAHDELETRVEERTAELSKANAELEKEIIERKRTEEALRTSEERFFKAFNASPDPMTISKFEDGQLLYVNDSFLHTTGFDKDEVIGSSALELNLWADPENSPRLIQMLHDRGRIHKQEIRFRLKSCEMRTGLFSAEVIEVGGERCILTLTSDITERKRTEEALQESEARYRSLVETLPTIVYRAEPQPPYSPIYVSPNIESLGYSLEEWFGRTDLWVSLLHPDDREWVLRETEAAMAAGRENDYEYRAIARDGAVHWFHDRGQFVLDEEGKPLCWQGVIIDITERKRAEAKLAEMNAQIEKSYDDLLSILNQLRLGVAMIDEGGRVAFLSQTCQNILGKKLEEVLGGRWEEVFPFQEQDKAQLTAMSGRPPERRAKIPIHVEAAGRRRYWLEIDVQDDPRESRRKIFFLYDVSDVHDLRRLLDEKAQFQDLVGKSKPMQLVYQQIQEVSRVDSTVLIEGETGTGKELVARAVHTSSHRQQKPFVAVNCAGLSDSLLASQLFGHKRGAFTGAIEDHIGLFEAANGGTLFLDEIGDIPMNVQTSLLRVLQEREITRLGESKPRKIDVRVLAATYRNLNEEVARNNFRPDLLYRIRVVRLQLPPLRERREDIPLLAGSFLAQCRAATGKPVEGVSNETMRLLLEYAWPGNVRELKSAIEVAVIRCKGSAIHAEDLPPELLDSGSPNSPFGNAPQDEKQRLLAALKSARGNRTVAAHLLGISRATLYRRLASLDTTLNQ